MIAALSRMDSWLLIGAIVIAAVCLVVGMLGMATDDDKPFHEDRWEDRG